MLKWEVEMPTTACPKNVNEDPINLLRQYEFRFGATEKTTKWRWYGGKSDKQD